MNYLKLYENFDDINLFCSKHKIGGYTIDADGSINVDGDVTLEKISTKSLPVKFKKVEGHFSINMGNLTTLEGCPETVLEYFLISGNSSLKTLKGCPKYIKLGFVVDNNSLENLDYFPEQIGGIVSVSNNKISSLRGCIKHVHGEFYCNMNNLYDLKGGPEIADSLFNCGDNHLVNFEGGPKEVKGNIVANRNNIFDLKGVPDPFWGEFYLHSNPIYEEIIHRVEDKYESKFIKFLIEFDAVRGHTIIQQRLEEAYWMTTKKELDGYKLRFEKYQLV